MANRKPDYTLTYFFHEGYTNLACYISNKKKNAFFWRTPEAEFENSSQESVLHTVLRSTLR